MINLGKCFDLDLFDLFFDFEEFEYSLDEFKHDRILLFSDIEGLLNVLLDSGTVFLFRFHLVRVLVLHTKDSDFVNRELVIIRLYFFHYYALELDLDIVDNIV